jgi:hypothetical protein
MLVSIIGGPAATKPPWPDRMTILLSGVTGLEQRLVDPRFSGWNQLMEWLRNIETIQASE